MAIDDGKEKVLCIATEFLWEALARATGQTTAAREVSTSVMRRLATQFQGFRPFGERFPATTFLDELDEAGPVFMDRTSALERDPQFKQLIPYAYLSSQSKVWTYQRAKQTGDPRLRGRVTAGVGGHVNPEDGGLSLSTTLLRGLERELREEISYSCGSSIHLEGVINDDSDEVGRVHLGVVYRVELARREVKPRERTLIDGGWHSGEGLRALLDSGYWHTEGWSRILIDERIAPKPRPVPAEAAR